MIDLRELSALHSSNIKLCLSCPDYGKNLPGDRLSDIFTYLGDLFPSPASGDQNDFDLVLNEVSVLISGLMEYFTLSQAVFKGKNIVITCCYLLLLLDLAMFITQAGRLSKDCQIQLNTVLDLQTRQSQLASQVIFILVCYFYYLPFQVSIHQSKFLDVSSI